MRHLWHRVNGLGQKMRGRVLLKWPGANWPQPGPSSHAALSRYSGQDPERPQQTTITDPDRCWGKHTPTASSSSGVISHCRPLHFLAVETTGFSERWGNKLKEPHAGLPLARYPTQRLPSKKKTPAKVENSHKKSTSMCLVKVQRMTHIGR